eukprot:gene12861-biopygen4975
MLIITAIAGQRCSCRSFAVHLHLTRVRHHANAQVCACLRRCGRLQGPRPALAKPAWRWRKSPGEVAQAGRIGVEPYFS